MSPGTGVDPGTSKTGRRLSPSALPFSFPGRYSSYTHKLADSMPTSATCLRPLKACLFQGVAAPKVVCDLCKS